MEEVAGSSPVESTSLRHGIQERRLPSVGLAKEGISRRYNMGYGRQASFRSGRKLLPEALEKEGNRRIGSATERGTLRERTWRAVPAPSSCVFVMLDMINTHDIFWVWTKAP